MTCFIFAHKLTKTLHCFCIRVKIKSANVKGSLACDSLQILLKQRCMASVVSPFQITLSLLLPPAIFLLEFKTKAEMCHVPQSYEAMLFGRDTVKSAPDHEKTDYTVKCQLYNGNWSPDKWSSILLSRPSILYSIVSSGQSGYRTRHALP